MLFPNSIRSKLSCVGILCCFAFAVRSEAMGQQRILHTQGAYTNGHAAYLTSSDIIKLRLIKAPVAVPTYVPAGYKLESVTCDAKEELGNFWSVEYTLKYSNRKGSYFEINSVNELGDPPFIPVLRGKNP